MALQGLPQSFDLVNQMGDMIQAMTKKALADANQNGGNFTQTDLTAIQQRQDLMEQVSNSLADVVDHASKLTAAQVQQVQQAVTQAAQSGNVAQLQQVVQQVTQGA